VHILTIEDPIEFIHRNVKASISQREVGTDTENFGQALRSALRQDPDVILIGEMRDHETVDIALKAAETGHLVLATVHTTDAVKTVNRLLSFYPGDEQNAVRGRLAESLKAVISQRLLPRTDGRGQALAMEIMVQTKTVQEYIIDSTKTVGIKDVIEKGRTTYGMQSFDQHLTVLYRQGMITIETARAAASNPADFERALNFE
jgi:twitching motility protein PilT